MAAGPSAPPLVVSSDQLMADVTVLSADDMQGRAIGTEGNRMARDYILRRFAEEGLQPVDDDYLLPFTAAPTARRPTALEGINVAGVVRGTTHPDRWIIVTAHYDHEGVRDGQIYNGADDNASGTAALFELARLLRLSPPRHSVMLVALDGEERGLLGAQAFVRSPPVPLDAVVLNINLDMVARGDNGILWVVGSRPYPGLVPLIDGLAQQPGVERRYGYDDPAVTGRNNWVMLSDQGAFHAAGVPFVFFSVDDHADYHQPSDDAERINAAWYRGSIQTAHDALRAVDATDDLDLRATRAVH
ncbi:M28 family peptidase [Brevundimonas sp.]|uniref:M28 family peptidase n=1 Tax=Brevundimonas sp. TaxID=1871086 RepID=UPI0025E73F3C|nr:M28 family peptidase [Brevundimonas sp.]